MGRKCWLLEATRGWLWMLVESEQRRACGVGWECCVRSGSLPGGREVESAHEPALLLDENVDPLSRNVSICLRCRSPLHTSSCATDRCNNQTAIAAVVLGLETFEELE